MSKVIHLVEYESRKCSCENVKFETTSGLPFHEGEDREYIAETTIRMASKNDKVSLDVDRATGEITVRIFGEQAHGLVTSAFWFLVTALEAQLKSENRSITKDLPQ